MMMLSLQVSDFCSLFGNGLFQIVHSVTLSWHLCVSFTLLSTKLCKDGMCSHLALLTRAASLVALCPFTPLAPFAVNRCRISSRKIHILAFTIQCPLDIATGLRHGGWGRYIQRGRYLCNARAPSSIGFEVTHYRQRGRYIQSRYIQWGLYCN